MMSYGIERRIAMNEHIQRLGFILMIGSIYGRLVSNGIIAVEIVSFLLFIIGTIAAMFDWSKR